MQTIQPLTILVVDDHAITRAGLRAALSPSTIFEADSAAGALDTLREHHRHLASNGTQPIDLVLLDYSLPDLHGVETTREILRNFPHTCILLYLSTADDYVISAAIRAGVKGIVIKSEDPSVLLDAIKSVTRNQVFLSPAAARGAMHLIFKGTDAHKAPAKPLSPREGQVLQHIAFGLSNKQIAHELSMSINTVRTIRERLYRKLKASNTAELVRAANRFKLLTTAE